MSNHLALFTDLYELTMAQAFYAEEMTAPAVFSLFVRRLPPERNVLLACGLDTVLGLLQSLRFDQEDLDYLASLGKFSNAFLQRLRDWRFTGDVYAVAEGTPIFANEPLLEVVAPLPEAQVVETLVMNQIQLQTMLASKALRVVTAAAGRPVYDFGARRMHGIDAALRAPRAFHIAGVAGTSNVLAGRLYGVPVVGTMAHSYIQAHGDEAEAFASFARLYPQTVLLVDTYDTANGVRRVVELARQLGDAFQVKAVRLDSGDLAALAKETRALLDAAGLQRVEILGSSGLDEYEVAKLLAAGAPFDGFGVGTAMGVSQDAPDLDIVYKLCEYDGEGRIKLSSGKPVLPGRKQVFRVNEDGQDVRDVIARADEDLPGRPLLAPVMRAGVRLDTARTELTAAREDARRQVAALPERVRGITPAEPPYAVEVSDRLAELHQQIAQATSC